MSITHVAGNRVLYLPERESITLPHMEQHTATAEYYNIAIHKLKYSSGRRKRLHILDKTAFFGSEAYSMRELIAGICASDYVNLVRMETPRILRDSAAYNQIWLKPRGM